MLTTVVRNQRRHNCRDPEFLNAIERHRERPSTDGNSVDRQGNSSSRKPAAGEPVERPGHAFIPFSVGQRQCMAQEVTFMMLRVALFEIYNRYRLRVAPGTKVVKNTSATTKPVSVSIVRMPREGADQRKEALAERKRQAAKDASSAGTVGGRVGARWVRPA